MNDLEKIRQSVNMPLPIRLASIQTGSQSNKRDLKVDMPHLQTSKYTIKTIVKPTSQIVSAKRINREK